MSFVLRMAVREMRASWKRLLFFFACLSLGVAAIVTLRSVIQSVRSVMMGEARTLIAGDILVSTGRGWSDPDRQILDRALSAERGIRAPLVGGEPAVERLAHEVGLATRVEPHGRVPATGPVVTGTAVVQDREREVHGGGRAAPRRAAVDAEVNAAIAVPSAVVVLRRHDVHRVRRVHRHCGLVLRR